MVRRAASLALLAIGLVLSIATSNYELEPQPLRSVSAGAIRVASGLLAEGAPILLRVTVDTQARFYTEDNEGRPLERLPLATLTIAFPDGWERTDGTLALEPGTEGDCGGSAPGALSLISSADLQHVVDANGPTLLLLRVTGDAAYEGTLELDVHVEPFPPDPDAWAESPAADLFAEVVPLPCRIEPAPPDTGSDTATP